MSNSRDPVVLIGELVVLKAAIKSVITKIDRIVIKSTRDQSFDPIPELAVAKKEFKTLATRTRDLLDEISSHQVLSGNAEVVSSVAFVRGSVDDMVRLVGRIDERF